MATFHCFHDELARVEIDDVLKAEGRLCPQVSRLWERGKRPVVVK
jgi:hypothetical protein